eukprot:TRINITY_DN16308_c0_g1_i2.p1 TRINITY_DN16308_c0_g1~~TRINITY_DN16308_c0_g1_i2.p1  ORF type:complete len:357 (+),score=63.38 TRINITY_DN16308_c0_g1_i2:78-1073(+)
MAGCGLCGELGHAAAACAYRPRGPPEAAAGRSCSRRDSGADAAAREPPAVRAPAPLPPGGLRVGTLNVHRLGDARRMAQALAPYGPFDALAVQEAPAGVGAPALARLAEHLGMRVAVSQDAGFGLANALLLSGSPAADAAGRAAARTAQWSLRSEHEPRSAVAAQLGSGLVAVCAHLDAYTEGARMRQWQDLLPLLGEFCGGDEARPCGDRAVLLMGDLNALRAADYSAERWSAIAAERGRGMIQAPQRHLTDAVEAAGFRDCRREAAVAEGALATCRHRVRVDYIYASPGALRDWRVARLAHAPFYEAGGVTDHALVVCDLEPRSGAPRS